MKKTKENLKNNNFTKLTRSGISLIVLVITIIVIIILAAAIIISLNNNNPIMEANKARYESDRANIQAVFTNAVAKVMAKNGATISISAGQINTITGGQKEVTGEVAYTLTDAQNVNNSTGKIVFDNKTSMDDTVFYTGKKLPIYAAGETKWYVDEDGNISLEVGGNSVEAGKSVLDTIIIDYAKPVTLEYGKTGDSRIVQENCTSNYGNITIEGDNTTGNWKITYTLNKFLNEVDEVHLVCENGEEYIINIVPANNIYYEDDFAAIEYTGNWQVVGNSDDNVEIANTEVHGGAGNTYLADDITYSGGSTHLGNTTIGDERSIVNLTFTGTGIDVYIHMTNMSGAFVANLTSEDGAVKKNILMDNKFIFSDEIVDDVNNILEEGIYQIPTLSIEGLTYGTYTVKINLRTMTESITDKNNVTASIKRANYYLDGIRIYNPLDTNDSFYNKNEQQAIFTGVKGLTGDSKTVTDNTEIKNQVLFLDKLNEDTPILGTTSNSKNEIYVNPNQATVFKVGKTQGAHYYVGLKNPTGDGVTVKVSNGASMKALSINAASDLYYEVIPDDDGYIAIINTSGGSNNLLAITKLRTTGVNRENDIVGISVDEAINYISSIK